MIKRYLTVTVELTNVEVKTETAEDEIPSDLIGQSLQGKVLDWNDELSGGLSQSFDILEAYEGHDVVVGK